MSDDREKPVRVRVAPSPTGDPHLGTAYQALFNYAFARRHGGQFVLRIEDTDRQRSSRESEEEILAALRWLGLAWDEGPDQDGPHAPYRQSERLEIYREHAERLLASGAAYRDFSTREEIARERESGQDALDYVGHSRRHRDLDPEEAARRAAAGEEHVVRLRVPTDGVCTMHDVLRGAIEREWSLVDDQVLLKSDGFPTYHLANVVDDHLMEITHVIRGEEWISSLPKHLLLYEKLGWQPPLFCHLPLLRNDDANRSKLSKRRNPTSIDYYRRAGYLPEALLNFLGLMGLSRADGDEKLSLEEFVEGFDLEAISLGGPVFDQKKLRWLNARYLREDFDAAGLVRLLRSWRLDDTTLERIAPLAQPRLETLGDWGELTAHLFADLVEPPVEELTLEGCEPEQVAEVLQMVAWRVDTLRPFVADRIHGVLRELAEQLGFKLRQFTRPLYVAISGKPASTPLFDTMEILGRDLTRARLRAAVERLGGLGAKKLKKLEKRYQALGGGSGGEGSDDDGDG